MQISTTLYKTSDPYKLPTHPYIHLHTHKNTDALTEVGLDRVDDVGESIPREGVAIVKFGVS